MQQTTMRRTTARHATARAMTLVEIVLVVALMALVMAFAFPKLAGLDMLGSDQQAKTTASGAMDTAMRLYQGKVTSAPWDFQAAAAAREAAETANPAATIDPVTLPHRPARPEFTQAALVAANTDVQFTAITNGDAAPSTGTSRASVSSRSIGTSDSNAYVTIGVAVFAGNNGSSTTGTCWMTQARLSAPSGAPTQLYTRVTIGGSGEPTVASCDGDVAARLNYSALRASVPNAPLSAQAGRAWTRPLHIFTTAQLTNATA